MLIFGLGFNIWNIKWLSDCLMTEQTFTWEAEDSSQGDKGILIVEIY